MIKILGFTFPVVFYLLNPSVTYGQEYKLHFDAGYKILLPVGGYLNQKDGVETVSLLKNFNYGNGISFNVTYQYNKFIKTGWMFELQSFKDWSRDYFDIYIGASADIWMTGPVICKTLDMKHGEKARFEVYGAPLFGGYKINLDKFYYIIHTTSTDPVPDRHEQGYLFGLKSGVNLSQRVTRNVFINLKGELGYIHLNSLLTSDRNIFSLSAGAGLTFNIIRNKTYYIFK